MTDKGTLETIDRIGEIPKRTVEALLEGLTKNPADFAIMGCGFIVGYEGLDVMGYMMRQMKEMVVGAASMMANLPAGTSPITDFMKLLPLRVEDYSIDVANLPTELGGGIGGIFEFLSKSIGGPEWPGKHITPASKGEITTPGISYWGPPPEGWTGAWPPYGITLSQLEGAKKAAADKDKWKWDLELVLADAKLKIVLGCLGAIAAYTISRPGFISGVLSGVGDITKGVGEIVPL